MGEATLAEMEASTASAETMPYLQAHEIRIAFARDKKIRPVKLTAA
jgi:hypothetical protein